MLPGLIRALRTQSYPIQRCIGANTGSADRSDILLTELIGAESVCPLDRSASFATAVDVALAHPAAAPGDEGVEWIWLLHDDCEPASDALEKLLRAAVRDRGIAVVGPKIRDLTDRRVLREAGVTIDRAGRRVTGIEPGEIDQGQHDGNRGVLAVSSAGMLVRRDVWESTGGFDEFFTMFRDDVDFCWRVHAAGHRIQVVTDAVLYHRELGVRRSRAAGGPHPRRLDRRNALYVLAVNLPLLVMLRVIGGCVFGSLLRAGWFSLTKQNDRARDHLAALGAVLGHPGQIWKARRRRGPLHKGYANVNGFIPPARTLRKLAENVAGMLTAGPARTTGGHQASGNPDEEQFTDEPSAIRRTLANPGVRLVAALTLVSLIAERRLLAAGTLGGGALVPAWDSASGLWRTYLAGFHPAGIGSSGIAPPYLAVLAALATVAAGKTWLAVDVLLLACVPLAGLTAYLASRRVTRSVPVRVAAAAAYAMTPVAMGAVAAGAIGTAMVIILLPLAGLAAARMITSGGTAARRASWAAGLTLGLMAAFVPALWLTGVALAGATTGYSYAARRFGGPYPALDPVNAAIAALAPVLVMFPWSLSLLAHPGNFLLDGGVSSTSAQSSVTSLFLLRPGGPGLPPAWVTAGLGLAAIAALFAPHRRGGLTWTGWAVAVTGLAAATVVRGLNAWPGPELAVAAAGLILAAIPAAEWLAAIKGRVWRIAAVGVLAVAASAPVLAAAFWLADGVSGPVGGVQAQVLPAFVSADSAGPDWPSTLVLREVGGVVSYAVDREDDPSLGEPGLTAPAAAASTLSRAVADLAAQDGADEGDPGQVLSSFAIKWVLLPGPVDAGLAQRLAGAAGLVQVSSSAAYDLWEVAGTVARARVIEPDGAVAALPSGDVSVSAAAPRSGGTLLLAEPAGGWTATLNGHALKARTVAGWEQAFTLPAGGGTLSISHNDVLHDLGLIIEALAFLAICVLALPGKRTEAVTRPVSAAGLELATGPRHALGPATGPRLALEAGTAAEPLPALEPAGPVEPEPVSAAVPEPEPVATSSFAAAFDPAPVPEPGFESVFAPAAVPGPEAAPESAVEQTGPPWAAMEPIGAPETVTGEAETGTGARRALIGSGRGGHRGGRHGKRAGGKRGSES